MRHLYIFLLCVVVVSCKKDKASAIVNIDLTDAKIEASSEAIIMGDSVLFVLNSISLPETAEFNWILTGATPSTSTLKNPKVKYGLDGTFDVKLVVKQGNKTDTIFKSKYIKVVNSALLRNPLKDAVITPNVSSIIIGDSVDFKLNNKESLVGAVYNWTFVGADPNTSSLANPKVKYKKEGLYDVKLIIKHDGRTDTLTNKDLVKVESTIIAGLMAYYPFNGNAKDMSGNGYDGTPNNAVLTTDRFGNQNAAYRLNGISSNIIVKDKPALRLNGTDFTINLWVNLDSYDIYNGSALLIKRYAGVQNGWGSSLLGESSAPTIADRVGCLFYKASGGSDPQAAGNKRQEINKWNMLTIVYNNQSKTMTLYTDGKLNTITPNIPSPNADCSADLFIGSDNYNTGSTGYYLKGKMDDIGFYNRVLSESEINRLYFNSETTTPPVFDK